MHKLSHRITEKDIKDIMEKHDPKKSGGITFE